MSISYQFVVNYYKWDAKEKTFSKFPISKTKIGTGLQIRVVDLNGDHRSEVVVAGKSGTYILWNEGTKK
jgi:hypothetical protein